MNSQRPTSLLSLNCEGGSTTFVLLFWFTISVKERAVSDLSLGPLHCDGLHHVWRNPCGIFGVWQKWSMDGPVDPVNELWNGCRLWLHWLLASMCPNKGAMLMLWISGYQSNLESFSSWKIWSSLCPQCTVTYINAIRLFEGLGNLLLNILTVVLHNILQRKLIL